MNGSADPPKGVDDESYLQFIRCGRDALGVYQQQRSPTARQDDRRRTAGFGHHGRLPEWFRAALLLIILPGRGRARASIDRYLGNGRLLFLHALLFLDALDLPPKLAREDGARSSNG